MIRIKFSAAAAALLMSVVAGRRRRVIGSGDRTQNSASQAYAKSTRQDCRDAMALQDLLWLLDQRSLRCRAEIQNNNDFLIYVIVGGE